MLYKRENTWHMDVTVHGLRYRESLKTSDKREASNFEKDRIAAIKAGKVASKSGKEFARKAFTEAAEQFLRVRTLQARCALDALQHGSARVELHLLLREVADLDAMSDADAVPAHQLLQQRRLAGTVRADESHVLRTLERERDLT